MAEKKPWKTEEINGAIRKQLEITRTVQVSGVKGQHCIAVGLPAGVVVQITGNAGDLFGALNSGASLTLNGNAGRFCGDSMSAGEIMINGDAACGVGQYLRGGTIVVKGDCKGPAGQLMKAGTVVIDGTAGREVGKYLMGGEIVVAGDAGERIGENLMAGVIFLRGEARSLGLNARVSKPSAGDVEKLKHLHKQYRFRGISDEEQLAEFQKVVPESKRPLVGEGPK